MSAFYFGRSGRQLFGYHHVPGASPSGAVVICAPWASEYQCAHRTLNFLGKRLASEGHHVLRFDYSGTGDSWGSSTDADMDEWANDVAEAFNELKMMSGLDRIDLVGLRVGAFMAARLAADNPDVRRVVLWDPILNGAAWLEELGSPSKRPLDDPLEVGTALVSARFLDQVRKIVPEAFGLAGVERTLLLTTQREAWRELSGADVPHVEKEFLEQPAPWLLDESIWTGQVPVEAVGRIVEWLG